MSRTAFRLLMTVALLLAPSVAFAHPGHGEGGSLLAGFIHPFSGIDHLLAMTAVGLFAANLGGRALWAVPATFVAMMALGGVFGAAGVSLPFAETAIALSVLVFGFVIFSGMTPPVLAAMALVGIFAIFHGHAHGTEMPVGGSGVVYGIGFMVATTLLHGFGITLGLAIRWFDDVPRRRAMQACGVAIALIGAGLTIGLV
ncbi:HupE/UreJ family protein [Bradyrhizobium sp.]|jgi:urease accessory protein|uniref:HupE/UreJ family protein n=1 Tax=Bradyrhizobium sp. TaxID=376 RepID=UPI0025C3546F|nr:HupE/UreJ family protein [Bradyrhizobium sp.]